MIEDKIKELNDLVSVFDELNMDEYSIEMISEFKSLINKYDSEGINELYKKAQEHYADKVNG